MDKTFLKAALAGAATIFVIAACDKIGNEPAPDGQANSDGIGSGGSRNPIGFYILNEGTWNGNNSTLDWYDFATDTYHADWFAQQNGGSALGDTGNDMIIYDNYLIITVNTSGYVEIADAATAKHVAKVEVPNCRSVIGVGDYIYVTSFDTNLYKISLKDFSVTATVQTGAGSEELWYNDGYIYVLNSGIYPEYNSSVTVIDESTFTAVRTVQPEYKNLNMILSADNSVYISAWGDYGSDPGAIITYDPASDATSVITGVPASIWCAYNNTIYFESTSYDSSYNTIATYATITGTTINTEDSFIDSAVTDKVAAPYCLSANPSTGEIILTDAADYASAGTLHYFHTDGTLAWSHSTGICPAKIAWLYTD